MEHGGAFATQSLHHATATPPPPHRHAATTPPCRHHAITTLPPRRNPVAASFFHATSQCPSNITADNHFLATNVFLLQMCIRSTATFRIVQTSPQQGYGEIEIEDLIINGKPSVTDVVCGVGWCPRVLEQLAPRRVHSRPWDQPVQLNANLIELSQLGQQLHRVASYL
jgi:hypothetical protein